MRPTRRFIRFQAPLRTIHGPMGRLQHICLGLLHAVVVCAAVIPLIGASSHTASAADQGPSPVTKAETVRPEVGKPLQAAQELIKAHQYKQALAKIQEADDVRDKTEYEAYVIERLRGVAAAAAGDTRTAIKSFEAAIGSGRMSASDKLKMMEAVADLYYREKDYSKAITWALRYGRESGADAQMRNLLIQSYFLSNDFPNAEKELQAELQADESAGHTPPEGRLQLLGSCYFQQKDMNGYAATLQKLVAYYPKKEYWADLIYRTETRLGFGARLALDVYRLKATLGLPATAAQYVEMTQLALQAGFPIEAKSFIDRGFATGVLGSGPDAARHERLRALTTKSIADDQHSLAQDEAEAGAAKEGSGLVNTEFAYVFRGQVDKGIELMERGIRKGGLTHPADARLHLGIAYLQGNHKDQAIREFRAVQGTDGIADLARLWELYARRT
jgi:Tetratricopeptide repeat